MQREWECKIGKFWTRLQKQHQICLSEEEKIPFDIRFHLKRTIAKTKSTSSYTRRDREADCGHVRWTKQKNKNSTKSLTKPLITKLWMEVKTFPRSNFPRLYAATTHRKPKRNSDANESKEQPVLTQIKRDALALRDPFLSSSSPAPPLRHRILGPPACSLLQFLARSLASLALLWEH